MSTALRAFLLFLFASRFLLSSCFYTSAHFLFSFRFYALNKGGGGEMGLREKKNFGLGNTLLASQTQSWCRCFVPLLRLGLHVIKANLKPLQAFITGAPNPHTPYSAGFRGAGGGVGEGGGS